MSEAPDDTRHHRGLPAASQARSSSEAGAQSATRVASDPHAGPRPLAAVGFAQRVKALATTAPLHDLDARKSSVQIADYTVYQMAELALQAIDLVTVAMDFDTGAHPHAVRTELSAYAAGQAPERPAAEHERVAQWVLENLLNVGSADRGFRAVYGIPSPHGYDRRTFDFKLLEETLGADGELYLRASNEAVNVLVGALEVDLEAAHIAADLRLEILIKRGRLSEAQAAAQNARYRTIQYGEMLRQHLDATGRDVRNVDWLDAVPQFIADALAHIEERYRAENAILVNLTDVRDTAEDPDRKAQAARLIDVVRDCLRRHGQLQAGLQRAGARFRAEQDRQSFSSTPSLASIDLHAQLLLPALSLSVHDADGPLDTFFTTAAGLAVPRALRLASLFDALITPAVERDELGDQIDDYELTEDEEPDRFPDASYRHLSALLDLDPEAPRRLSGMLAEARERQSNDPDAEDLPLLVVVEVLALAAQEIGAARRRRDASVVVAVDDGTPLDDPDFAGSDLLVARALLVDRADGIGTDGTDGWGELAAASDAAARADTLDPDVTPDVTPDLSGTRTGPSTGTVAGAVDGAENASTGHTRAATDPGESRDTTEGAA